MGDLSRSELSWEELERIITGYADLVENYLDRGWDAYLLSFMFHGIRGPRPAVQAAMVRILDRVYGHSLTRLIRYPNAASQRDRRPLWICCPDYPVLKRQKASLRDVALNDGLHYGAVAVVPPDTRLEYGLDTYFLNYGSEYVRHNPGLRRIVAKAIVETHGEAVRYTLKSVTRGRATLDDLVLFPRASEEL